MNSEQNSTGIRKPPDDPLLVWGDFSTAILIEPEQTRQYHHAMRALLLVGAVAAVAFLIATGFLSTF